MSNVIWIRRTAVRTCALLGLGLVLSLSGCASVGKREAHSNFAIGADVSFLAEAEAAGTVFKDGGVAKDGLSLFREHGYTWVRLRLFHTPGRDRRKLPNDLAATLVQAKRAKAMGFKLLLNFHYSDTWADPAHQITPEVWRELGQAELVEAVRDYTRECLVAFREAGAMPDMVQPGNEVTAGMLWPAGKLPENWDAFAELVRAGIAGVREGSAGAVQPKIMVQIERSGNWAETKWFFDHLLARGVEPDVLGQSYYPWWHGGPEALRETLHAMALTYKRPVMLVETAFPWRPTRELAEGKVTPVYPATPEGQRAFLAEVTGIVRGLPHGLGAGVFWWEPAVGQKRGGNLRSRGMFDDDGEVLPVIDAMGEAGAAQGP